MLGAGNRDPRQFAEPDSLDLARHDARPLTFGGGVHFCLGAALARLEIEILFGKLAERFAGIEATGEIAYRERLTLRGPTSLPVRLHPRRVAAGAAAAGRVHPAGGDDRA